MKFKNLKRHEVYPQVRKEPVVFWTKARCKILAKNYYVVPIDELRRLLGGASESNIRRQVRRLKDNGWTFQERSS